MKVYIRFITVVLGVIFFSTIGASAGDLNIPNTFISGTPAVAAEVNANFAATEAAVDDNNARINDNAADIAGNGSNIAVLAGVINSMAGIAHDEMAPGASVYPSATSETVLQVTINAPAVGFVVATYSGILRFDHTNTNSDVARVWINTDEGEFADGVSLRYIVVNPTQPNGFYYFPMSSFLYMPVTAGETTFYVKTDGSQLDVDGYILLYNNSLTLQFFPTNYTVFP